MPGVDTGSSSWLLIANPVAGRGRARELVEACVAASTRQGHNVEVQWTTSASHTTQLACDGINRQVGRILVAGGDGTIHRVLQAPLPAHLPIGLLPCGSGNDLCRALGITRARSLETMLGNHTRALDLGQCGSRRFATIAACGIDAEVSETKLRGDVALPGTLGYVLSACRAALRYQPAQISLEGTFGRIEAPAWLVATANTASYGGGIQMAPAASPDDGQFDIILIDGQLSRWHALTLLPRAFSGRHVPHPHIRVERSPWLHIESPHGARVLHADGERLGTTPAALRIQPRAVTILTPAPAARRSAAVTTV